MGLVWDYYPEGGGELTVALKLADHASHDGSRIWPAISTIADQTNQSERTVQRQIQAMLKRGWLIEVKKGGGGPGKTTIYRIPAGEIQRQAVGMGDKMSPIQLRVTPEVGKGDIHDKKGDIAMSPEPSVEAINREPAGRAAPSPVSLAFASYSAGIKAKYGADYPPSAKANGQLANVVSRVGAESVVPVIEYYLGSANTFYAKVKHSLDYLVRDCERIYLDLQQASGGSAKPATHADVYLVKDDSAKPRRLQDYPVGDPKLIASQAVKDYGGMIQKTSPRYVDVILAGARSRFSIEELR
jgi:hypothetical protein